MRIDSTTKQLDATYDMIIGTGSMAEMGLLINYSDNTIAWEADVLPMREHGSVQDPSLPKQIVESLNEAQAIREATSRVVKILDAKYTKANLETVIPSYNHLSKTEQAKLYKLLKSYEPLFDGTLGTWNCRPVSLELKANAVPEHSRPYPVPRSQETVFKEECDRLCKIGVLHKCNESEWAAPTFIVPKKNGTVRFLSDFRRLNKWLKRKPYPLPNIQDMLYRMEGFRYATSLDLNMGYYHIRLDKNARRLCTIILPWGKYEYLRLPMGISNSPDIFQERMSELMAGLEFIRVYIDDLLHVTSGTFEDHLEKLETIFQRLQTAGLKVNIEKSFFGKEQLEYLGYWITRDGVRPVSKKVDAIIAIKPPTTVKQVRSFVGMVNYYCDMWKRRSHLLTPLTALTQKGHKFKWTDLEQKAFDEIKRVLAQNTILTYPNFKLPFEIHTDASDLQLGSVIMQEGKPLAFYSRKLNSAQRNYDTRDKELLSIVETLKEFRNILFGHTVIVHTDHKNLLYVNESRACVLRWQLLIEEFGPEFKYIKGESNVIADALSRLPINSTSIPEEELTKDDLVERYDIEELPPDVYPLRFDLISKEQRKDKLLMKNLKTKESYTSKSFRGSEEVVCHNNLIYIPEKLQQRVVQWYHATLCHVGMTRLEETIRQHLTWPGLREDVRKHIEQCAACQRYKKQKKKYGHLEPKEAEVEPWDKLCVDLIGPYTLKRKGKKSLTLQAITMIDPATGWFEIAEIHSKQSDVIANIVEQTWLARYPWPRKVTYDHGGEFIGPEFQDLIKNEYGIKTKQTTVKNPQANSVLERIHQVLLNMLRTFELEDRELDKDDPWTGILSAVAFAVRSTYHTTTQATPGQLVFGRDMVLSISHVADWHYIKKRKQNQIGKDNKRENSKRINHVYQTRDKVLVERHFTGNPPKLSRPYDGPYSVVQCHTNGTITIRRGAINERINIRRVHPYKL